MQFCNCKAYARGFIRLTVHGRRSLSPRPKNTKTANNVEGGGISIESRKTEISVRAVNCINFRLVSHRYMTDKLPVRRKAPKPINSFKNMYLFTKLSEKQFCKIAFYILAT